MSGPVDLVLEGGGVKGIALAGALEVLEERGYRPQRIAGSSAGAIVGSLTAFGAPATSLVEILRATDYRRFLDGSWWRRTPPGALLGLIRHLGIHPGTYLEQWLTEQLAAHAPDYDQGTFGELAYTDPDGLAVSGPPTRLVVTATDLSGGRLRHLPRDAALLGRDPESLSVVEAVRASMAIPLLFRPARWRTGHGTATLVDGGLLSNFPVDVFDRPTGQTPRWPTFGIRLSARPPQDPQPLHRISGPIGYAKALLDTATGFYDRMHIDDPHALARTIFIDTSAVRATEFSLSTTQREQLYTEGRRAAIRFLDGDDSRRPWDFDRYIAEHRTPAP